MNKVCLYGRLTRDPEIKETNTVKLCNFSLAVQRNFKNKSGEYEADFINCVVFDKKAEFLAKYFGKGSSATVTGRMQTRKWDKDGETRYATEVIVEEIGFGGDEKKKSNSANTVSSDADYAADDMPEIDDDLPF